MSKARLTTWCAFIVGLIVGAAFLHVFLPRVGSDGKLRVLCITGAMQWEFRYLQNALLRDDEIEVDVCVTSRAGESDRSDGGGLVELPATRWTLFPYDVVVIGELPAGFFRDHADFADLLATYVRRGGGLLTTADDSLEPVGPLASALPVVLEGRNTDSAGVASRSPRLTPAGERHDLLRIAGDAPRSKAFWEHELPPLHVRRICRARPGATVLVTDPTRRDDHGALPLVVIGTVGRGTSLFLAMDSLWTWRRADAQAHAEFWRRAVMVVSRRHRERVGSN